MRRRAAAIASMSATFIPIVAAAAMAWTARQASLAPHLGASQMVDARAATALQPAALALIRAARYEEAATVLAGIARRLPEARHEATAAAVLGLRGSGDYRRLVASTYANLGLCQLRLRRFPDAEASLRAALAVEPANPAALASLGSTLIHQRRYREAVAVLLQATRTRDDAKLQLDLGHAHLQLGNLAEARDRLSRAVAAAGKKRSPAAWGIALDAERELAQVDVASGLPGAAVTRLRALLARAPGDVQTRYQLSRALARGGEVAGAGAEQARIDADSRAMASIQASLAGRPDTGQLAAVAREYRRLGLVHLAEIHYLQVLAREPGDAAARVELAGLRAGLSDDSAWPGEGGGRARGSGR